VEASTVVCAAKLFDFHASWFVTLRWPQMRTVLTLLKDILLPAKIFIFEVYIFECSG